MKKIILLVLVTFSLQSCIFLAGPIAKSALKSRLTVEKGAIPPDLGKDNTYVVCLLQKKKSRDKYLKKYFKKNYKGKHIFLTEEQLKEDKYADSSTYRYIFTYDRLTNSTHNAANPSKNVYISSSNYYIYDRHDDKNYNSGYNSSYFGKFIDAYTINLEKHRLKNKKK